MASLAYQAKTARQSHPGRDGKFLKDQGQLRGVSFYNSAHRQGLRRDLLVEVADALDVRQIYTY